MARERLIDEGQAQVERKTRAKPPPVRPYSQTLRRHLARLDGRTCEGKFIRAIEAELTTHLGGRLTVPQRLLVTRIAKVALRLELLDAKIANGEGSEFDIKVVGGLSSQFRLMLKLIGLDATSPQAAPPSLREALLAGSDADDAA